MFSETAEVVVSKQDDIEILIIMPVFADKNFFSLICLLLICLCSILPSHKTPLINFCFQFEKGSKLMLSCGDLNWKWALKKLSFVKWSSLVNTKQAWEQRLLYTHLIVTLLPNSFTFIQPIGWRSFCVLILPDNFQNRDTDKNELENEVKTKRLNFFFFFFK